MKLYHGTSQKAGLEILKYGLMPRSMSKELPTPNFIGYNDAVYLTDTHPTIHAYARCQFDQSAKGMIFEVENLDKPNFSVDENILFYIADKMKKFEIPKIDAMNSIKEIIDPLEIAYDEKIETLSLMGTIAYKGHIPMSQISQYAVFDIHIASPFYNPPIDYINDVSFRLHKTKFKMITDWIMGYRKNLDFETFRSWEKAQFRKEIFDNNPEIEIFRKVLTD